MSNRACVYYAQCLQCPVIMSIARYVQCLQCPVLTMSSAYYVSHLRDTQHIIKRNLRRSRYWVYCDSTKKPAKKKTTGGDGGGGGDDSSVSQDVLWVCLRTSTLTPHFCISMSKSQGIETDVTIHCRNFEHKRLHRQVCDRSSRPLTTYLVS